MLYISGLCLGICMGLFVADVQRKDYGDAACSATLFFVNLYIAWLILG